MSFELRTGEEIKSEVNLHWIVYIFSGLLMFLGALVFIIGLLAPDITIIVFGLLLLVPFVYIYLINKFKKFIVTNQRVYIKIGIIARKEDEIPIKKINNVTLKQGILQRILGAGDILIFVGNDTPIIIKDIDEPTGFKDAISQAIDEK